MPETTTTTFKLRLLMPNVVVEHKSWVQRRSKIFDKELFAASSLHWNDPGYHFRRGAQTLVWAVDNNKVRCKVNQNSTNSSGSDMFTVRNLLLVLATLPVSVATSERSFSTLRRAKTLLRSRMAEDRLNGLCLLNIHRGIPIEIGMYLNIKLCL